MLSDILTNLHCVYHGLHTRDRGYIVTIALAIKAQARTWQPGIGIQTIVDPAANISDESSYLVQFDLISSCHLAI